MSIPFGKQRNFYLSSRLNALKWNRLKYVCSCNGDVKYRKIAPVRGGKNNSFAQ